MRFSELDGARVGVWGAGREIRSFSTQLRRRLPAARIAVAAFDAPPSAGALADLGAPDARIVTAGEALEALLECEVLVRSPGVSIHRPELRALAAAGVRVTTATGLWLAERGGEGVIGVTGTKGKSTTAALAAHVARASGLTVALAGNIGAPALDLLDGEPAQLTVLELSSYQIADLEVGPRVALVTNVFREHTEWHGSEETYRAEKLRLLELPGVRVAVLNGRDERLRALDPDVQVRRYGVAAGWDVLAGVAEDWDVPVGMAEGWDVPAGVAGGWDVPAGVAGGWDVPAGVALGGELMASGAELPLRGEHNALNLCGALTALEAFGVAPVRPLARALEGFKPLAHRLEPVAEREGVAWVNDSISTTPESALAAIASFPGRPLVLIAGGQDRGQDYSGLASALAVGAASVIGVPSTGSRVVAAARAAGVSAARAREAPALEAAVALARDMARPGAVVLLSPAAPSFDHYRDFEERGERFRALVR